VTIESCNLFSHLPSSDLEGLRCHIRELHFQPGQEIFKAGDPGNGVYVVKSGQVEISAAMTSGQMEVLCRVPPGDAFGEMSLLDQHPRSAWAKAFQETTVFFIPREPMVELLKQNPDLSVTLIHEISERLREFNHLHLDKILKVERTALVGRFASSIVHDLKNPLTIIGMAARSGCRESATPEERSTAETRINKMVDRITGMVNDILEFTRGNQTQPSLYKADYAEFVNTLLEEIRGDLDAKGVPFELENPPPSVAVQMNPRRLTRVFHNLIANATDAIKGLGGAVRMRFEIKNQEGMVVTEIQDGGPGIDPENLPRIFEAFATFGKAKGTGLGLAIVQRILEEHQGMISARNSPEGGAVFTFALPLAD